MGNYWVDRLYLYLKNNPAMIFKFRHSTVFGFSDFPLFGGEYYVKNPEYNSAKNLYFFEDKPLPWSCRL
jgi:hypothetical protein